MTDTPLSDDVVERSAKAIEATTGYSGDIARRQARAALEAARYGEMRDLLKWWNAQAARWMNSREHYARPGWMQVALEKTRALLSSIGASHE